MENSSPNYMNIGALVLAGGSYVYAYQATNALKTEIAKTSSSIEKTNDSLKIYDENTRDEFKKINEWIVGFNERLRAIEEALKVQIGIQLEDSN